MTGTTSGIINWARLYIPDPKTRTKTIRGDEIGYTALPTNQREVFYVRYTPIGSVNLYVEPYMYSSTSSLKTAATTSRVFLYNATLQKCTFPSDSADRSIRPEQNKAVLAYYEYTEKVPYTYSDTELAEFLPAAISYLNNTFNQSYTYTGTVSTLLPVYTDDTDKEIISRALALIVRKSFVSEQMRRGLGVAFRGPMAVIDSKSQLLAYQQATKDLEKSIADKIDYDKINAMDSNSGSTVDLYEENET